VSVSYETAGLARGSNVENDAGQTLVAVLPMRVLSSINSARSSLASISGEVCVSFLRLATKDSLDDKHRTVDGVRPVVTGPTELYTYDSPGRRTLY